MWDGDLLCSVGHSLGRLGSEPTVWDGDFYTGTLFSLDFFLPVPSPPCGMVTRQLIGREFCKKGSEPTVWDGDS